LSRRYFGTDGVRGIANAKLTPELAFKLGLAAARWLIATDHSPHAVIGRDTRRSGPMLGAALASGLCSGGVSVTTLGVAPTPTVSFVARTGDFSLGGIVSASHNPAPDNGIKFVGHDGRKLPDEVELQIESFMEDGPQPPIGAGVGWLEPGPELIQAYLHFLVSVVPERLDGMKVAVDGAHGAAYALGPEVLRLLGAEVHSTGVSPDGMNINAEGGATKPETVGAFTVSSSCHVGVAFDGDADRAIFCDEHGKLINGDRTMGAWAVHRQREGDLEPAVVVGTVMSNGGFERYLTDQGIKLERTPVGDKYVAQRIQQTGALIGGEQSGHVIFPRRGPTGDGLVTMLEFLRVLKTESMPASHYSAEYEPWPQLLVNVTVAEMDGWKEKEGVAGALERGEKRLGSDGRIVVRPSGTQPMIRVMVEALDSNARDEVAASIVTAMEEDLGGKIYSRVDLTHALGD
jgi:phosphoglucosamine mutase